VHSNVSLFMCVRLMRSGFRNVIFGEQEIEGFGQKILHLAAALGLHEAQRCLHFQGEISADIDLPTPAWR
jgi:hypothetical protein